MRSGAVVVLGAAVGSQMPLEAGAGRWSWDICGMKPGPFPQVARTESSSLRDVVLRSERLGVSQASRFRLRAVPCRAVPCRTGQFYCGPGTLHGVIATRCSRMAVVVCLTASHGKIAGGPCHHLGGRHRAGSKGTWTPQPRRNSMLCLNAGCLVRFTCGFGHATTGRPNTCSWISRCEGPA
jgi:hypothetical protein